MRALFAEWIGQEWRIAAKVFRTEYASGALEIAEDIALLDASELVYIRKT